MLFYIRSMLVGKYFHKTVWVLNHFLTMECYRKLCNRLYWKKLERGTLPYTTRCWLIVLSAFSAIWLAFFFDPMDPTNSKSPSRLVQLVSRIFHKIEKTSVDIMNSCCRYYNECLRILSGKLGFADNVLLNRTQFAYLGSSSLLI